MPHPHRHLVRAPVSARAMAAAVLVLAATVGCRAPPPAAHAPVPHTAPGRPVPTLGPDDAQPRHHEPAEPVPPPRSRGKASTHARARR